MAPMVVPWWSHGGPMVFHHNGSIGGPIVMALQWDHHGTIMGPPWDHHGTTMGPPWDHHGTIMGPPWDHHGTTMGPPWDHHGMISSKNHHGTTMGPRVSVRVRVKFNSP